VRVNGALRVPGDKSISHRTLMLAVLADGTSRVSGLLESADVNSTAGALRALGATIADLAGGTITVRGLGRNGLRASSTPLDCGNSGTSARLLSGILAALPFSTRLVGDASLSRRPMTRIARPLTAMGARLELDNGDGLPAMIHGGNLHGITWFSDTASAQVKSAILLAGLVANVPVEVHEPALSRDHTERMLRARGIDVRSDGNDVALLPGSRLEAVDTVVPGDPSSTAFFAAMVALAQGGELAIEGVCTNPSRIGSLKVLSRMGARVRFEDVSDQGGEPVARVVIAPGTPAATAIEAHEIPSLIDELPVLACVASRAAGVTTVRGAGELRVKESDRIKNIVRNLRAVGADAEEHPDGFDVCGSERPYRGAVVTEGDHRIAMAFGVLGALDGNEINVDDRGCVGVSYPGFWSDLERVQR
jgi:3-phosphoshikimate 1-carboxyvinyltransferase